jgi:hypothetical protein
MNGKPAVLSMNGGSFFPGGDRFREEFLRQLAEFRKFIRDHRCPTGNPHLTLAGFFGGQDADEDNDGPGNNGNGNAFGHGKGHGNPHHGQHGNPHCPPVSP